MRRWSIIVVLLWSTSVWAQTAVDKPQIGVSANCNGASAAGIKTCAIAGITAGSTLFIGVLVNSGTLTPVVTETAQSATVNDVAGADQLSASAPALYEGVRTIVNAAGGSYTISSNDGGGGADTTTQTIIIEELKNVAAAPTDRSAKLKNAASTNWAGVTLAAGNLAQAGEFMVNFGGSATTLTTIVPRANSALSWTIPTNAKELTLPSGAIANTISGDIAATGIGTQYTSNAFTVSTSSANLIAFVTFKPLTATTILPWRSTGNVAGETLYGQDTSTTVTPNLNSSFGTQSPPITSGACIFVLYCSSSSTLTTPTCTSGNSTCTGSGAPLSCCTGAGTGACVSMTWKTVLNETDGVGDYATLYEGQLPAGCLSDPAGGGLAGCTPVCTAGGGSSIDISMIFTGANGCNPDGTPAGAFGTGLTATAPTDTGAKAGDMVIVPVCNQFASSFGNPNPFFEGVPQTGAGDGVTNTGYFAFYPITATGTLPAEGNTFASSVPWETGEFLMAGPLAPTPTATATSTPTLRARYFPSKHVYQDNPTTFP